MNTNHILTEIHKHNNFGIDFHNVHDDSLFLNHIKNLNPNISDDFARILIRKAISPMWNGQISIDNKIQNGIPLLILSKLRQQIILLRAGTGSGKSLSVAPFLMNQKKNSKIILTQPRILTTQSIALRMAEELNEIGYSTGAGTVIGSNTQIEIMTEAILHRKLSAENISSFNYIILDEVHERNIDTDLNIYKLSSLLHNSSTQLIIMSATLDIEHFQQYFHKMGFSVAIAEISGIRPEIIVNFLPNNVPNYYSEIINIATKIISDNPADTEILIFLPSKLAISEIQNRLLKNSSFSQTLITPLFSGIGYELEQLAKEELSSINLKSYSGHTILNRIILATDVAETGITFSNLKFLIDSGWKNRPYYDPYTNADMLVLDSITKGQALQRWGRVGRKFPGIVYCVYTKQQFSNMDSRGVNPDEIKAFVPDADICKNIAGEPAAVSRNVDSLILTILSTENDISNAKLIDYPPFESVLRSFDTLFQLGAIDDNGQITSIGRKMNHFKYPVYNAKMLCIGSAYRCINEIIIIVAMDFVGIDNLINSKNSKLNLINHYYSDHINLWMIYTKYQTEKYNQTWISENNVNVQAFNTVDAEIIEIKKLLRKLSIPLFPRKIEKLDEMISRIQKCLFYSLFLNLAEKITHQGQVKYQIKNMPQIFASIINSAAFSTNFPSADKLFPPFVVFEKLTLINNNYFISHVSSIPSEIIQSFNYSL